MCSVASTASNAPPFALLSADSALARLVRQTEAALDVRRSLLALHSTLNSSPS